MTLFTLADTDDLIERFNNHKHLLEDSVSMVNKYMPKNFTENREFMDWKATLINILKSQPGRNSNPLNYVIRDKVSAIILTNTNFIDDYVDRTPLTGKVFNADVSKVHLYIS